MTLPINSAGSLASDEQTWQQACSDEAPDRIQLNSVPEASDSLARFFQSIAPQATRFAMSMTHRWCDAEELVQESFFRLARVENQPSNAGSNSHDPGAVAVESARIDPQSRKSYLFTTIRNLAIDRIRQSQRRPTETRELDQLAGRIRITERQQTQSLRDLEDAMQTTFERMSSQWAEALKLKINGELSYAEIAKVLDATTDQVRGWIYRARKMLATELRQQGLMDTNE